MYWPKFLLSIYRLKFLILINQWSIIQWLVFFLCRSWNFPSNTFNNSPQYFFYFTCTSHYWSNTFWIINVILKLEQNHILVKHRTKRNWLSVLSLIFSIYVSIWWIKLPHGFTIKICRVITILIIECSRRTIQRGLLRRKKVMTVPFFIFTHWFYWKVLHESF